MTPIEETSLKQVITALEKLDDRISEQVNIMQGSILDVLQILRNLI